LDGHSQRLYRLNQLPDRLDWQAVRHRDIPSVYPVSAVNELDSLEKVSTDVVGCNACPRPWGIAYVIRHYALPSVRVKEVIVTVKPELIVVLLTSMSPPLPVAVTVPCK
jgi:hypothetical protein